MATQPRNGNGSKDLPHESLVYSPFPLLSTLLAAYSQADHARAPGRARWSDVTALRSRPLPRPVTPVPPVRLEGRQPIPWPGRRKRHDYPEAGLRLLLGIRRPVCSPARHRPARPRAGLPSWRALRWILRFQWASNAFEISRCERARNCPRRRLGALDITTQQTLVGDCGPTTNASIFRDRRQRVAQSRCRDRGTLRRSSRLGRALTASRRGGAPLKAPGVARRTPFQRALRLARL